MSHPRRTFLASGAAALAASGTRLRAGGAWAQATMQGKRFVRQASPENLEQDFGGLADFITPTDEHYVRSHFAVPPVDAASWTLSVKGAVGQPYTLTLAQLRALPKVSRVVTLECAGNGRSFLVPAVGGVQWERGAVSTAEWTGVRLADLLARAGVATDATRVVFDGLDRGEVKNTPLPAGPINFNRSLSLAETKARDVIVAYAINGTPLPAAHGAPARLIVPGCYGMASVKWLSSIEVIKGEFGSYWETTDYAYWDRSSGRPLRRPLLGMQVKSLIARPSAAGKVVRGSTTDVVGAAWSDGNVTRVEVSTDGGATWRDAEFMDPESAYTWRRWRFRWQVPATAGQAVLMSRATDAQGRTQPMTRNNDWGTYVIHHVVPVPVTIA
ncbi:sulfite oxidase [Luteitalea sp. TBR-22]|uniref:sulfite oxidase n=1 Tax=Luteitalea sp. TBR-22 TaxID=2802971 RepID=UPI001AF9640D|nr:sulfite oxidase [Luteitalea sp. TBR-22]BCS31488.1 sulfite oxidase [Luteitalea sp. TBR-22]